MTQEEIQQMQTTFAEFKTANEAMQGQIKAFGKANTEIIEKVEKVSGKLDGLETKINARMDVEEQKAEFKKLRDRIDEVEQKVTRKGQSGSGDDPEAEELQLKKLQRKAFFAALRFNPQGKKDIEEVLGPELFKALIVSNDTAGGYLAPPEYVNEILKNIVEWTPIRPLCRQRSTTRTSVQIPKRTGTAAAAWVQETGTRAETTNPAFGMEEIKTHELYAMTKVSKQELEDSQFDIEAFLREEFSEQFGLSEGTAFISGTGAGQPEGILTNADISFTVSGDANLITPDGLISIYYDIKEAYLVNATWVMNRSTLKKVRQLKDTTNQYLWAPGIKSDARPATILDRPYITAPDMPAIAANEFPVLFGDFRRGYIIVDRIALEVMSDPYTSKSTGMIEFSARRRVGGQVIIAEAIRKLKIAA